MPAVWGVSIMRMLGRVLVLLLFAAPCFGQELKVRKFDTGWWARIHWTAAALDDSTTGLWAHSCNGCTEANPLTRPLLGNPPKTYRLALGWAGESLLVSRIPNKRVSRITQIGLIGAHLAAASWNLKHWH